MPFLKQRVLRGNAGNILDQTTFGSGCKIWSRGFGILNKYFELRSIKICIFLNPPPTNARFYTGKKEKIYSFEDKYMIPNVKGCN